MRAIDRYLEAVWEESVCRGYRFDATKVVPGIAVVRLTVSCGQLDYEFEHLKRKLELRSPKNYMRLIAVRSIGAASVVPGYDGGSGRLGDHPMKIAISGATRVYRYASDGLSDGIGASGRSAGTSGFPVAGVARGGACRLRGRGQFGRRADRPAVERRL